MVNAQEWLENNYPKNERGEQFSLDLGYDIQEIQTKEFEKNRPAAVVEFLKGLFDKNDKPTKIVLTNSLNLNDFVNMEELTFNPDKYPLYADNKIDNLVIDNCRKIKIIDFGSSNLTNLDISDYQHLQSIFLYDSEKLNRLTLINNSQLEEIDCEGCQSLHTLVLNNNPKLKSLNINNNTQITINLEYLPESLEKIYCDGTKLVAQLKGYEKTENISGKTYYDYKTWRKDHQDLINKVRNAQQWLESQEKYNTKEKRSKETNLDISNKNLEGKLDLNDFVNLESLKNGPYSTITEIDVSKLNKLVSIDSQNGLLTKIEFGKAADSLENLSIASNNFPEQDLSMFSGLKNLETLDISNSKDYFLPYGFNGSLKPLENLTKLKSLNITNTNIESGLEYLSDSCTDFFYGNSTGIEGIWSNEVFAEKLKNYTRDGKVDLHGWHIDHPPVKNEHQDSSSKEEVSISENNWELTEKEKQEVRSLLWGTTVRYYSDQMSSSGYKLRPDLDDYCSKVLKRIPFLSKEPTKEKDTLEYLSDFLSKRRKNIFAFPTSPKVFNDWMDKFESAIKDRLGELYANFYFPIKISSDLFLYSGDIINISYKGKSLALDDNKVKESDKDQSVSFVVAVIDGGKIYLKTADTNKYLKVSTINAGKSITLTDFLDAHDSIFIIKSIHEGNEVTLQTADGNYLVARDGSRIAVKPQLNGDEGVFVLAKNGSKCEEEIITDIKFTNENDLLRSEIGEKSLQIKQGSTFSNHGESKGKQKFDIDEEVVEKQELKWDKNYSIGISADVKGSVAIPFIKWKAELNIGGKWKHDWGEGGSNVSEQKRTFKSSYEIEVPPWSLIKIEAIASKGIIKEVPYSAKVTRYLTDNGKKKSYDYQISGKLTSVNYFDLKVFATQYDVDDVEMKNPIIKKEDITNKNKAQQAQIQVHPKQ